MVEFLSSLFLFVLLQMGIDPNTLSEPTYYGLTNPQMKNVICVSELNTGCKVPLSLFIPENNVLILSGPSFSDKTNAGFLVHQMVHYVQFQVICKKNMEIYKKFQELLEEQAETVAQAYINSEQI